MLLLPKIEKVTRDVTLSHFLLMFGYKLFSLYFPLFLVARGMSLPEVGYAYLLIYLPIALFAPVVGYLNHKINPAILAGIGILGYAAYALSMILIYPQAGPGIWLFYCCQVLLGVSAALFFVSARAVLIGSNLENYDRSFGWFYSAPFYADAVAPAVGALFIWQFGFVGVFIFSLIIQVFTSVFCCLKLRKPAGPLVDGGFNFNDSKNNYKKIIQFLRKKTTLSLLLISFSVLLLAGFYHAFFVLFLKEELVWSQEMILIFISVFSVLFSPLSLLLIKLLEKISSERNIFQGGMIAGSSSIIFGLFTPFLNFLSVLVIGLGKSVGALICNAGRSGLISKNLKTEPEEAGAIDTVFSPLGIALGALISGLIIGFLGYQTLFIFGGAFVILVVFLSRQFAKI